MCNGAVEDDADGNEDYDDATAAAAGSGGGIAAATTWWQQCGHDAGDDG